MMAALGYMLISVVLFLVIGVSGRIFLILGKKEPENIPMGPILKEFSDLIIEHGKKFIPIEDPLILLISIDIICVVLIVTINKIFIG
ncbi:hypothetical protein ACFLTD_00910 [Elusimicrobiota bacterium]